MVLLHCHGCGARATELVESLGLTMVDLFDDPLPPRPLVEGRNRVGRSSTQRQAGKRRGRLGKLPAPIVRPLVEKAPEIQHGWEKAETYPYVDESGNLTQEVIRELCRSCAHPHKRFTQVFVDAAGQRRKRKPADFHPVLYRTPEILAQIQAGGEVWLLEGEKDVATAEGLGLVATTNTQGGAAFPVDLAPFFAGAIVNVVLDRDDTGWARGVAVSKCLTEAGATVHLYLPATTAAKSDFTDHIEAGHAVNDLIQVHVEEVAAWEGLSHVRKAHTRVEQALSETQAHRGLQENADSVKDEETAREHFRSARRWAFESEIRFEVVREALEAVGGSVVRTGTEWAGEALAHSEELFQQSLTATRAAHEAAKLHLPPSIQTHDEPSVPEEIDEPPLEEPTADEEPMPEEASATSGQWSPGEEKKAHGSAVEKSAFRLVHGEIVELVTNRRRRTGRDEYDEPEGEEFKTILSLDVQIIEMEFLEEAEPSESSDNSLSGRGSSRREDASPSALQQLSAVVITYTHPDSNEPMQARIPADDYKDGSWLDSLPGPPMYDSKPSGVSKVRDAIKAVSPEIRRVVRYRSTGWRCDDDGNWSFIHARGAISADGAIAAPVLLTGPLARYDLPDPSVDAARLRQAFLESSGSMLGSLPVRVSAPLLGHVFRSALGANPWVMALIGSPGSYKTSLASIAMHHWGEQWDRRKPASSLSGNGTTLFAQRIQLHAAKDTLYWMDDVAPTKGWSNAQQLMEETVRMIHNAEERIRSARDGQSVLDGTPPRASGLITSEVMPRPGSAAQRMLIVPLQKDEIDLETLITLDSDSSRYDRALLMSSMIRWLATCLDDAREQSREHIERYAKKLREAGESDRTAEASANAWAGWKTMCAFLVDIGAITVEETVKLLEQADVGLVEAIAAAADPDLPTRTGARVRELISRALTSGAVFVEDVRTGEEPNWPLGKRLGWRRTVMGYDTEGAPRWRYDARGMRVGYVNDSEGVRELLLESIALEQLLKAAGSTMADAPQLDRGTALKALLDEEVLIPELCTGKTPRCTVQRTIYCEDNRRQRMVALRLDRLFGDEPDEDQRLVGSGGDDDLGDGDNGTPLGNPELDMKLFDLGSAQEEPIPAAPEAPAAKLEEHRMSEHTDAAGNVMHAQVRASDDPCLICGQTSSLYFGETSIHAVCFWSSTPESRQAAAMAGAPAVPQPAPKLVPTKPAVAAAPEPKPATAAAKTPKRADTASATTFSAPAAVVDVDGIHCADGSLLDLPELQHAGDLAELVDHLNLGTQVTKWRGEPGQIWVTAALQDQLGMHVDMGENPTKFSALMRDATKGHPFINEAIAAGWKLGGGDGNAIGAWTRIWHSNWENIGKRGVWLVMMSALDPALPMLDEDPAVVAARLAKFAAALEMPWAMSPSTTGLSLMYTTRGKRRIDVFDAVNQPTPAVDAGTEQDFDWTRKPDSTETEHTYVHAYDRGGSYLAGVASTRFGIGQPTHHAEGIPFDKNLPGYWLINVPAKADWRAPNPLLPMAGRVFKSGESLPVHSVWRTTSTIAMANELGYEMPILEAYTWEDNARLLDTWYGRIRDARAIFLDGDDADAKANYTLLKELYVRTIGIMGSKTWMDGKRGYRPDWRHQIVAKARANILRQVHSIGESTAQWPVALMHDTVLYTSDNPDPFEAWPGDPKKLGTGIGQFKHEGSALLKDHIKFLDGGIYHGKELLLKDWDPAAAATRKKGAA